MVAPRSNRSRPASTPGRPALWMLSGVALLLVMLVTQAAPSRAMPALQAGTPPDQGAQLFQSRCTSCHTIGQGKLVGPDLQGVTQRRDVQWIKNFITDPNKVFAANDPTATQLLSQNNNIRMPALGLSPAEVDALVAYLQAGTAPASGTGNPAANLAAGNPAVGARLFSGEAALVGGGPACMSCHSVQGAGGLGGGSLGPDLTHVATRYGPAGLAAAIKNIAFPTMVGPFTGRPLSPQEQADLLAYLSQVDQQQPPVANIAPGTITANTWQILIFAVIGTAALFVVLAFFWPRQRQSVSQRLRSRSATPRT